ncbi:MAG TPA: FAD-binding oxidoreductase, partial [Rhodospirillales bacterium]|nr:FAD-binding oxidoreductase [Rhodospirillales bacterium]
MPASFAPWAYEFARPYPLWPSVPGFAIVLPARSQEERGRSPVDPTEDRREPVFAQLSRLLGERFRRNRAVREQHGRGEAFPECHPPDAVAFPESTDEVAQILRLCHAGAVPVVPYGVGTSLEGHVAAVRGGLCLDLSRMNRI